MSKAELKALKKSIKQKYVKNPAAFKEMIDKYNDRIETLEEDVISAKRQVKSCNSSKAELEESNQKLSQNIDDMTGQMSALEGQLAAAKAEAAKPSGPSMTAPAGAAFAVQIGYYEKFNINDYFLTPKLIGSESVDGGNKYVITYFTNEGEAERFRADIQKMGIKDAWVVRYIDGQRVSEEEFNTRMGGASF